VGESGRVPMREGGRVVWVRVGGWVDVWDVREGGRVVWVRVGGC